MLRSALLVCVLAASRATLGDPVPTIDLIQGVRAIDTGGNPASMVVWGEARALVVAPNGSIFAAAATLDNGRIVVLGHGGFVSTGDADTEIFVANAVEWLAQSSARDEERSLRIAGLRPPAERELAARSLEYERVPGDPAKVDLNQVDVVIGSPEAWRKTGRLDELDRWLRAGGGMLLTETAWGVLQLNPDLTLETLAANRLLEPTGIRFTGEAHSPFGAAGDYPVEPGRLDVANADYALEVLAGTRRGDEALAGRIVGRAFAGVPLDGELVQTADALAAEQRAALDEAYRRAADARIDSKTDPLAFAMFDLDARRAMELAPEEIEAHPSSSAFPGPVGDARLDDASVSLDTSIPGWRSTGLYAPPGELVRVRLPEEAARLGITIQIGAWRDPHRHPHRVRMKDALRRFPIEAPVTKVASAIGGPIYVDLPATVESTFGRETLTLEIDGAAPMPYYRHGETDLNAWCETIRRHDAPWAELESDELVLTVPSSVIRDLDRPDLVMDHWDRVTRAMWSLEPRSSNHWPDRQYRYVADASVSWGWMYCPANAPIVIPMQTAAAMVDAASFDGKGPNRLWGHYHEMGHAHQSGRWTDGATTEVTVNIFTVYALHSVNRYPLDSEVMRSDRARAWAMFEKHRASGEPYEQVGGPFPRLQMYALLWHDFGFDAFRETFGRIRDVDHSLVRSLDTTGERNLFIAHFSETIGRDLSDYFGAWGVEVTDETRRRLADLPTWMPAPPDEHARSERNRTPSNPS
jgi:hypothetical protein